MRTRSKPQAYSRRRLLLIHSTRGFRRRRRRQRCCRRHCLAGRLWLVRRRRDGRHRRRRHPSQAVGRLAQAVAPSGRAATPPQSSRRGSGYTDGGRRSGVSDGVSPSDALPSQLTETDRHAL